MLLEEAARRALRAGVQPSDICNAIAGLSVEITQIKTREQRHSFIHGADVAHARLARRPKKEA